MDVSIFLWDAVTECILRGAVGKKALGRAEKSQIASFMVAYLSTL